MDEVNYSELLTQYYADDIDALSKYIQYFEARGGKDVASDYDGKQGKSDLRFPVFDSMLLRFTDEASKTKLMDPNYMYGYRSAHISTVKQESDAIIHSQPKDLDLLKAILSRYVLEGRYKGSRWIEGAERKVFLNILVQLRDMKKEAIIH
ncbi:MAG: hypothetical protein J5829_01350 [Lachnospiraceae bacterium]|nr:hypothetical protein [Lachnospiraceae bacterium]